MLCSHGLFHFNPFISPMRDDLLLQYPFTDVETEAKQGYSNTRFHG